MSDSLNPTPDAEQLMLGAIPGKPALGRGPAVDGDYSRHPLTNGFAMRKLKETGRRIRRSLLPAETLFNNATMGHRIVSTVSLGAIPIIFALTQQS
jgi:hypothetical protein